MVVITKTVCPFPFAAPPGVNATSPSQCTLTYGQALGAGVIVMQALLLATGTLGVVVFSYRLLALHRYCLTKKVSTTHHTVFPHFVLCVLFNLLMIIGAIDPYGFWNVVPIEFYAVIDEMTAATGITIGVMTVKFLYKMSHNMQDPKLRDSTRVTRVTIVLVWCNFVGLIIPGIIDHARFELYEGLKVLFGSIILFVFWVLSTKYAIQLRRFMTQMLSMINDRKRLERHIKTLESKHLRFSIVVLGASIAMFVDGIIALTDEDQSWTLAVADLPDPTQLVTRVIYILITFLTITYFQVPSTRVVDSSHDTGHEGGTTSSPSSAKTHGLTKAPGSTLIVSDDRTMSPTSEGGTDFAS
jgi:hypothetical protein